MTYDFDTPVNRLGSDSLKWKKYADRKTPAGGDILPLWVADMDFQTAPEITAALQERIQHGIFGYGYTSEAFNNAVVMAMQRDYGWQIEADWIIPLPGLVSGLNVAARAIGNEGDAIVTSTPVYPPLFTAPENMGRKSIRIPLKESQNWSWDMETVQAAHTPNTNIKGLFLCNPHNPIGRVWTTEEKLALANYAEAHDLIVVSDEIHCDLILEPGLTHQPFATLSPEMAKRTITLMAPSKTYNIPGLGASFAVIADTVLRERFLKAMNGIVPHPNILGMVACTAAYQHGAAWRNALLDYLRKNREQVMKLNNVKGLRVISPEATYLAWIDCRALKIDNPQKFFETAGAGLSPGSDFGDNGFVRLNFGCTAATLSEALQRMRHAVENL